ncbi:amidohydrolase family protein [Candidatus Daviesbacteria bacterium]|nr:amidohydrolase family protein [Candidatus Daviesbacteria bacterium]
MSKIVKLPGLVDVHVHLREPGNIQKEDFATGSKAAIAGGYTTIFDMPNNPNPIVDNISLEEKIDLAPGRIFCDLGFHFGGSKVSVPFFEQVKKKVWGLKVYMNHTTGPLLIEDQNDLELIFANWPKSKIIMVHAEGPTLATAIDLAKRHGQRLHVCHLSLASEIDQVRIAKEAGMPITAEVSAHHLFLTNEDLKRLGPFGIMKPPLSSKKDVEYIWKNLDVLDMVASDHAPHTVDEKLKSENPPFGVPGLETTLPLLLNAVAEKRLTLERVIELTSTNPKKVFGLSSRHFESAFGETKNLNGSFSPLGARAQDDNNTYIEVDLDEQWEIRNEFLYTKCGWTPFNGVKVKGRVKKVVLREVPVFNGEQIMVAVGQVIYP